MKKIYWISVVLLTVIFFSCSKSTQTVRRLQTVRLDTVKDAAETTTQQYPGRVVAANDINLSFRVSGTISRVYASDGAFVKRGELLAELDPTDYQLQLNATEAEYKQIAAETARIVALYKDSSTTASNYDKAVYGLKQIGAKYQYHKDQLKYTKLYAPFDGCVTQHLFEAYENVAAGMPVTTIISSQTPEVEINLPAAAYIHSPAFTQYYCMFDIYPGRIYPLRPISMPPKANANQLYTMRLQLEKHANPMPTPGMNTTVTIGRVDDGSKQFYVPNGALLKKNGRSYVYVFSPTTNTVNAHEVNIVRPLRNGNVLVVGNTLMAGNLIVSSGTHYIKAGETVKPLPPKSETNVGNLL